MPRARNYLVHWWLGFRALGSRVPTAISHAKAGPNGDKRGGPQSGFTLVEIIFAMVIMAILASIASGAMTYYLSVRSIDVAVRDLTSQIREGQELAVTTGNTYRLDFTDPQGLTYTLKFPMGGGGWANYRAAQSLPGGVSFDPSPSLGDNDCNSCLDFSARGSSGSGQLTLRGRFNMTKTLNIQGETVNITTVETG